MTEKKARNAVTGTRKKPPANAAETLLELAASGYNKKGLAYRLGTTVETLNKWLEIHPELQQALDEGQNASITLCSMRCTRTPQKAAT